MRRFRLLAGALLAAALLAAGDAAPARAAGSIVVGTQLEPTSLDPTAGASSATGQVLFPAVYEGLVRLTADGTAQPLLASAWDISADGLTYVFHLRRGARFHDGTPFDARSVKFSLERAIAADSINPQKPAYAVIAAVDIRDASTVVVSLRAPSAKFLQALGWSAAVMLSPASAASDGQLPIGTGPFRFSAWRRGTSLDLLRNPDYWGVPAKLDRVTYRFIADPSAALAALKAGDVDAFDAYPAPETVAELRADPRFVVTIGLSQAKTILALNNRRPPFDDLLVRRALSQAVDRQAVIDAAMFGYGQPIGSHFPPQDPDYLDLTGRYPYDPAAARALLARAGHPAGLQMTLTLPPLPYAHRAGEVIAGQLRAVGVTARLRSLEWSSWLDEVFTRHDFDATIVAHVEPMDYDIYGRDDYYFGYSSPVFKDLLKRLDRTADAAARRPLLADIQRRIAEDAVNVFLFEYPAFGVWNRRITGLWHPTPAQLVDLAGASLREAETPAAAAGGAGAGGAGPLLAGLAGLGALAVGLAAWRAGPAYLAGRLAVLVAIPLAASLAVFLMLQVLPGDPARFMLGMTADPQAVAALRHRLGLEGPPLLRYLHWLAGLAGGDYGVSYTYGIPVGTMIGERLAVSLPLAVYALALSGALALAFGLAATLHRGRSLDRLLTGVAQLGIAIPEFWLGLLLVLIFAETLHWAAAGGFPGWQAGALPGLAALTLPALALALPKAAILGRVLRTALFDTLGQDYLRTARAKGSSEHRALLRHALPNVLAPVLTVAGLQATYLLADSIVVETVFSLPGLGRLVFQAVGQRDLMVVQAVVVVLVFAVVAVNTLVDLLCAGLDPRWRLRTSR